jgi:hypothetical protein
MTTSIVSLDPSTVHMYAPLSPPLGQPQVQRQDQFMLQHVVETIVESISFEGACKLKIEDRAEAQGQRSSKDSQH